MLQPLPCQGLWAQQSEKLPTSSHPRLICFIKIHQVYRSIYLCLDTIHQLSDDKVLGGSRGESWEVNYKTEYLVCWVSILNWSDLEPEVFVVGWQCLCLLEFPWFVREMFVEESNPLEDIWHLCLLEQASISCPTVCSNCQLDGLRKYFFTRFILHLFLFLWPADTRQVSQCL